MATFSLRLAFELTNESDSENIPGSAQLGMIGDSLGDAILDEFAEFETSVGTIRIVGIDPV